MAKKNATESGLTTPFAVNMVAILVVMVFSPIVMGWGMTSGYYAIHRNAPNDTNIVDMVSTDYEWLETGNCTNPSNIHFRQNATGYNDTVGNNVGDNFTAVSNQGFFYAHDCQWGPYEVRIYDESFYGNLDDNISAYYIKFTDSAAMIPTTTYNSTGEPPECSGEWRFHAEFKVEGVTQFENRGYQSPNCYGFVSYVGGNSSYYGILWVWSIEWYHEINAVEASEVAEAIRNCEPNCNITVRFSNIQDTDGLMPSGSDLLSRGPWIQEEVYRTDNAYRVYQLGLSAWILAIFFGLFAVASTPLWNPFKSRIANWGEL